MTGLTPLADITASRDLPAAYARLRRQYGQVAPVLLEKGRQREINGWLLLGHREILDVVQDERRFARDPNHWRDYAQGLVDPDSGLGPMMFPRDNAYFADGDTHRRLRAPLDEGLRELDQHAMQRRIRAICTELTRGFVGRGHADLIAEYASYIPMLTVAGTMFGIDLDHGRRLRDGLLALFGSGTDSQDGYRDVQQILGEVLHARKAAPAGDLTTAFLHHPNLRNDTEVMQEMLLMISAGYETTAIWIARTLLLMLGDPRFSGNIRGGTLGVNEALDEVLRLDPPMTHMPARFPLADCQIDGRRIERGDALILGLAAAGFDPRIHTGDWWQEIDNRSHLGFSAGSHTCPAKIPARLITRVAVETALHELPGVTLADPQAPVPLIPSPWTRHPAHLHVVFPAADRLRTAAVPPGPPATAVP
ncbi:cytochrome P450 [Thermomonospora echinospora]|nr:cytochrome P450 [Thermomonospora echinospora]